MHAGHEKVFRSAPYHCGGCQLREASNLPVQLQQASLQGSWRSMCRSIPAVVKAISHDKRCLYEQSLSFPSQTVAQIY